MSHCRDHMSSPRPPMSPLATPLAHPLALASEGDDSARLPRDGVGPLYPRPPPSPLSRRTFSERRGTNETMASPPLVKRRAFSHDCQDRCDTPLWSADATTGYASSSGGLRTIPSQLEMDEEGISDEGTMEALTSRAGCATPTRRLFRGQQQHIPNRERAASSDVALAIGEGILPCYDDALASHLERLSNEEGGDPRSPRRETPTQRGTSFSTPERPVSRPAINRARAHTCPHRPQRHALLEGGDEEAGHQYMREGGDRSPRAGGSPARSPERSPGRRRRTSTSPTVPPLPPITTPSSARRMRPRPPASAPHVVSLPGSPLVGRPLSARASSLSTSARSLGPQLTERNVLFRVPPLVVKALMVSSLYMLLAYTWDTDLRARYQSVEINYGLAEYWQGGLASHFGRAEKIGRHVPGKLFNDDGDDGGIAALLGGDDRTAFASGSASGDAGGASEDVSLPGTPLVQGDGRKRRPSLSYARSVSPPSGAHQRRAARKSTKWTLSKVAWGVVWLGFALPVVEAGVREARRRMNVRMWGGRRIRSLRSVPGGGRGNVHHL